MKSSITCWIVTLIILGGMSLLIAWTADRMKSPTFTVDEATVTAFNLTADNHLTAAFSVSVRSHNHDRKYSIEYKAMVVVVYLNASGLAYDQNILGGRVKQAHGDDVTFTARPAVVNAVVSDSDVVAGLRKGVEEGNVRLEVRVRANVRFEVKGWKHRSYVLKVICSNVVFYFSSKGSTFEGQICKVDRF